ARRARYGPGSARAGRQRGAARRGSFRRSGAAAGSARPGLDRSELVLRGAVDVAGAEVVAIQRARRDRTCVPFPWRCRRGRGASATWAKAARDARVMLPRRTGDGPDRPRAHAVGPWSVAAAMIQSAVAYADTTARPRQLTRSP